MSLKDVAIIGAGAAGATTAFHLARAGKKVVLLEKNDNFTQKPCGGGMASAVQKWFPFGLSPVVEEIINTVEFSWCLGDPVVAKLPGSSPFWIVRREELDKFLASKAINEGAELLRPFKATNLKKEKGIWKVTSEDNIQIESRAVVIADGSKSPWPQLFNIGPKNQHHASTLSIRLEGRGNLKEGTTRFEFGLVHHGFAWAFPLRGATNVGIGSFIGKQGIDSKKILTELLPSLGFNPNEGYRQESSLRVWNGHNKLHGEGILAVGDSASICDPFLAEGLRPALMSGHEAAKYLNLWLQGDTNNLEAYSKSIKAKWGDSMAWAQRISQIFYRFPQVGYQLGIKRPTAPKRIAQILSGQMGYGDIAQRVIKRLIFSK